MDSHDILEAVLALPQLALRGLMVVAHPEADPQAQFEAAAQVQQRLHTHHPGADIFSAGMSQDFESAIAAGATHLRIGSAILGSRD